MEKVVVIGNGPAAHMAAIYLRTANMDPLLLNETTEETFNFKGFDKVVGVLNVTSPEELIKRMMEQIKNFNIRNKSGKIEDINENNHIIISIEDQKITTKFLVIDDPVIFERLFGVKKVKTEDLEKYANKGIFPCGKIVIDYEEAIILIGSGCEATFSVKEYV